MAAWVPLVHLTSSAICFVGALSIHVPCMQLSLETLTCSVRLTWDVFVRDLNRQLGTPSHWLHVDSYKEGQKGALAAVCTPTKPARNTKNYAPPYRSTAYGTLKVVKRKTVSSVYFLVLAKIFP